MLKKLKQYGPNLNFYIFTAIIGLAGGLWLLLYWLGGCVAFVTVMYLYLKYKHYPIITSLLDTDWYKITMQQAVYHQFPNVIAQYRFINRGKTQFPPGFAEALTKEVKSLRKLSLTDDEYLWLLKEYVRDGDLQVDYVNCLANYKFDPSQVAIKQTAEDLEITINGPWVETILWEVPLMAIISELYFRMMGKTPDNKSITRMIDKSHRLSLGGVKWIDFGTRRRFSKLTQDNLNYAMKGSAGYLGTSNPYFAMKYDLQPVGTFAHEAVMAMQALYGNDGMYHPEESNFKWLTAWLNEYTSDKLRIALTDTLTTEVFFRDFNKHFAEQYAGVRQDSGDPAEFARKMIQHYKDLGIDPKTKKLVFSDSLDVDKAIALEKEFGSQINCVMGIGTHLTNDCGHKPLNMVVKLTAVDVGNGEGYIPVVKLSDDPGKHTGVPVVVENVKKRLGLC